MTAADDGEDRSGSGPGAPVPEVPVPETPVTEGRLLGGRLIFRQSATGYRTAIDPVLLAAAVPADLLPGL